MAKFCPNLSTADSGHLQIVNIMVQPDFWLGWSIASVKLSHMTRKPTRCWKLALVVRLNILRFVIDLKRKCWCFPAFKHIGLNFSKFSVASFVYSGGASNEVWRACLLNLDPSNTRQITFRPGLPCSTEISVIFTDFIRFHPISAAWPFHGKLWILKWCFRTNSFENFGGWKLQDQQRETNLRDRWLRPAGFSLEEGCWLLSREKPLRQFEGDDYRSSPCCYDMKIFPTFLHPLKRWGHERNAGELVDGLILDDNANAPQLARYNWYWDATWTRTGFCPTLGVMKSNMNISSDSSVWVHVGKKRDKKQVRIHPQKALILLTPAMGQETLYP